MTGDEAAETSIESLLRMAMGCIGMGLDDFCRCTPSEFYAIFDAWNQNRTAIYQTGWEQTRFIALATLQPHSTKTLRPADIMPLPWERQRAAANNPGCPTAGASRTCENRQRAGAKNKQEVTRKEMMERYRAAKRRLGLK